MKIEQWLNTELGIEIWKKKYQHSNETLDQWFDRISGGDKELRRLLVEKKFLFGGRTLSNRGLNNGSYSNCYSSGFVQDDLKDIMNVNTKLALTYKAQGGQGVSLSKIRPKGTLIAGRYESDGIVPIMEMYNKTTESIMQGGCIHEDELVLTSNGYTEIKNIKIGDKVWTKEGFIPVNFVFDKGEQEVFKVITAKGNSIRTTIDHKYCIDGFTTKKLSDLKVGDTINLITKHHFDNIEFDNLAYFLGVFNGDGHVVPKKNGGTITLHRSQKYIGDKLIEIIQSFGFDAYYTKEELPNALRVYLVKDFLDYLDAQGLLKNHAEDILVPDFVMKGNDSIKASYIAGAIDSDGSVYTTSFKYNTISQIYANQIHLLLSSLGFFPSTYIIKRDESRQTMYEVRDSFRLGQCFIPSLKIEHSNIQFTKNSKYSTPYSIESENFSRDEHKHLKKISKTTKIGLHTYLGAISNIEGLTRAPMIIDTISQITSDGLAHVYDISLESEHLFDCNGIYVSNSRKGALMISIDIKHKEAETFISIKSDITKINKANLSVEIDDEFMEIVEKSYKTQTEIPLHVSRWYGSQKIEYTIIPIILYKKLIKQAHLSAEPGVLFVNRFRNYNLMQYCEAYQIETCNPCLHPDSVIETSEGKVKIKDMTKPMMVYSMDENGKLVLRRSTPSWISKKSSNTLNIYINNGEYLTCTPDHKIFIEGKGWIEAQDVKIGDSPIALLRRRRGVKYSGVRLSSQPAGSDIMEHRFIYEGTYGEIPDGFDIHHIDEDTYNNVIDNLECLSHSEHSTLTRYSCPNNHQIKDEDTGRFVSSEKKKKTIIPLPENICTNFKSKPRVINISQGDITDVYDINVEETHCFIADGIIVHNCGEQPLPKDGACNLGSINISEYVLKPFTKFASFDVLSFVEDVGTAVRALDDIIDENFPNHAIKEQREMSQKYRNIGLGMMGVADALIKLGYTYGDEDSINFISGLSKLMFRTAALSSAEIAKEKGTFPAYASSVLSADILKNAEFSSNEWEFITYHGLRNCSLLSIAPTGTLGTMLNISTGIEPNFALSFIRKTEALSGEKLTFQVNCGVAQEYFDATQAESLPDYFVTSHTLNWKDRINFQSAAQEFIDTAISSTINLPKDISVDEVEELYLYAWKKNLKGVTIYRDGCRDGILTLTEETKPSDNFFIRPEVLPAKVMHFKNNNEQWVAFIGEKDGRPFEIFTGPADMELFPIPKFVQSGEIIKVKVPGKETRYDFRYIDSYGYQNTLGGLSRCFDKEYWNYARLVSGMLRQQVKIASIVEIVDGMHTNSESLHSWKNGIIRALKSFIPDGTESTKSCHVCGGKIVYVNGCTQCESCGESKCS